MLVGIKIFLSKVLGSFGAFVKFHAYQVINPKSLNFFTVVGGKRDYKI